MKKTILLSVLLFPLFLFAQLSGTYTIGPSGNYSSFTAAVSALTTLGVSGPVIFNIAQGTYIEQISIPLITGADSVKTITFQSANGDSTSVILTYSPTTSANNFTIKLNQTKFINFKQITIRSTGTGYYGRVVLISYSKNNNFINNAIKGAEVTDTYPELALVYIERFNQFLPLPSYNKFYNNYFINGSYGFFDGATTMNSSNGTEIIGNRFSNQYYKSIYLDNEISPIVKSNFISNTDSTFHSGIYCYNSKSALIEKNNIQLPNGVLYGIFLEACNTYTGNLHRIQNNVISINAFINNCKGLNISNSNGVKVYNNSILLYGSNNSSRVLSINPQPMNIYIKNNILSNYAGGYSIYIQNGTSNFVLYNNNNNLLTSGPYLGFTSTSGSAINLTGWKNISLTDSNSVSINPNFYSNSNLHVSNPLFNNLGIPLPEVTDDIDGETRDSVAPDIGADEFTIPAKDIGVKILIHSLSGECFSTNETIKVRIKNYGISTIHFSVDTAIISANATGANPITFIPVVISSDSLKPDSTMDVVISTNYNMSASGSYVFNASTTLTGDGNTNNDAMPTQTITNYLMVNYPHSETIETFTTGNPGTLDHGWTSCNTTAYKWNVESGSTPTSNTGPLADHTTYSTIGKYVFVEADGGAIGDTALFVSPCINLNPLSNPGLTFWYHMYGSGIGSLNLDVYNGSNWVNNVYSITGQQQTSSSANWLQASVSLSAFSGTIKLRFRAVRGINQYGDIALDDIKIGGAPYVNLGPDTNICAGSTITLDAGAGTNLNYTWKKVPSPIIIGTNQTITVNQAGTYYVIVTNQNGLGGTDSITITISQPPTVNAGANSSICAGNIFTVSGDTATNYTNLLWTTSGTGTFSSNTSFSPTYTPSLSDISTASVYLTLSAYGIPPCANVSDSLLLTINPLPILSINGLASSYCVNAALVTITGNPSGGTFTGNGISGNIFNPQLANLGTNIITYSYTDGNGCSNSTTQAVTVNSLPLVSFSGLASSYCINSSTANLIGSPSGGTFNGNGITGNTFNPVNAGIGTHSIIYSYTDVNGCSNSDTQSVVLNALPVVSFTGLPTNCCLHDSAFLLYGNTSGGSFSGSGIVQNVFNPFFAGTGYHNITYTFTDANSCTNSTNQNITVYPNPIANAGTNKTIACGGAGVMIGSGTTSGFSYQWYPTNSLSSSTISNPIASPNITTIYTLTLTNNTTGCTATDEVIVSITGGPTATAWPDTMICEGQSVVLYSSGGNTYLWSTNATPPSIVVSPLVTTDYSVTVTTGGCSDADTVTVTVNPLPLQASIPAGPTDLCINSPNSYYTTVATHALTCQWFLNPANAGQITSNNNTATIDWNNSFYGNVELSVLGLNLCGHGDTSNSLNIEIHLLPIIDLGKDTTICKTQIITLDAGSAFASYLWSTGDTTQSITVDSIMGSGTYSVTVTDSFSCTNSDNIVITFDPCIGYAELTQKHEIKIYPNPSKGIFTIETSGIKDYINVSVFSIQGKEIIKENIYGDKKIKLDLSNHPKGVYFIKLWNNDFVGVEKVVLQ